MRIHKYLSSAGICSRRKAEVYVAEGKVRVNGLVAKIGDSIDPAVDTVTLDSAIVQDTEELVYYKMNKPRGVVTTCATGTDKAIVDIINIPVRVFPIGRLDKATTGLILLTNDGRLSHRLMHPSFAHEKEYIVEVYGKLDLKDLGTLRRGVKIGEEGYVRAAAVRQVTSGRLSITLTQGKNRQIRRMLEAIGYGIKKLKRIRIQNVLLGELEEGDYIPLSRHERTELLRAAGLLGNHEII